LREDVGGHGEHVGEAAGVAGHGERNEANRDPGAVDQDSRNGRHHQDCEERDGAFARGSSGNAAAQQPARSPSAREVAEARHDERDPRIFADGRHVEVPRVLQVFGKPEDVEIPDGVHENLRKKKGPYEAHAQQLPDAEGRGGGRNDFFFLDRRCVRCTVDRPPEKQPDQAGDADGDESDAPSPGQQNPGDDWRREDSAHG